MIRLPAVHFWSLAALFAVLAGAAQHGGANQEASGKYWIFLVTGKSAAGVAKDEIQAMQRAHLDNFSRLAQAKQLLCAGPMADPNKKLRGIVVVQASQPSQISGYFTPDPYVSEGYMQTEVNRIVEQVGELTVQLDATQLQELRIVIWDRVQKGGRPVAVQRELLEEHSRYWEALRKSGKMALRCRFADDSPRFGTAILMAAGDETLKEWLDNDPMVRQGRVTYQRMPQYLVKGAVTFSE